MTRRSGRWWGVAVAALLAVGGCSAPPPVEEVIPRGGMPQSGGWCHILSDAEVASLLGDGELDRVRQVGAFDPGLSPSASCDVVWADGGTPVTMADGWTALVSEVDGVYYRDEVRRLGDLLGPHGQRLESGEVEQLRPGVYLDVETGAMSVFLGCGLGEDVPGVMSTSLVVTPTETGEAPGPEELALLGERVEEMTRWVHQCPGDVTPLGVGSSEELSEGTTAGAAPASGADDNGSAVP